MKQQVENRTADWDEAEAWLLQRDRPVCAWCHEPIVGNDYYGIDRETVCRDCVEACRHTAPAGR